MADTKRYRLNGNKTKLYNLAKKWFPEIVRRKDTESIKYPRSRDCALKFKSGTYYHRISLMVCGGSPILCDNFYTYDDDGELVKYWETIPVTTSELRAFGLVEEVA